VEPFAVGDYGPKGQFWYSKGSWLRPGRYLRTLKTSGAASVFHFEV
jgi:hypothetical protein